MKNWNTIGFIKAIFIVGMAVFTFSMPDLFDVDGMEYTLLFTIGTLIGWIFFGTAITYVLVKSFGGTVTKPNWNNNPLNFKEPFNLIQFVGIGAIILGTGNMLGVFVNSSEMSLYGAQNVFTGIGLLISMRVSEKILLGRH